MQASYWPPVSEPAISGEQKLKGRASLGTGEAVAKGGEGGA